MNFAKMLGLRPKAPIQPTADPREPEIAATRDALARQQAELEAQRRSFQEAQNRTLQDFARLAAEANARPNAIPQGVSDAPPQLSSDADIETDENLDALRKGRRGLRIDLQATLPGGTGGLNVPRG